MDAFGRRCQCAPPLGHKERAMSKSLWPIAAAVLFAAASVRAATADGYVTDYVEEPAPAAALPD